MTCKYHTELLQSCLTQVSEAKNCYQAIYVPTLVKVSNSNENDRLFYQTDFMDLSYYLFLERNKV